MLANCFGRRCRLAALAMMAFWEWLRPTFRVSQAVSFFCHRPGGGLRRLSVPRGSRAAGWGDAGQLQKGGHRHGLEGAGSGGPNLCVTKEGSGISGCPWA